MGPRRGAVGGRRKSVAQIGVEVHGLQALELLRKQRAQKEREIESAVLRARRAGYSWASIGQALGVTHQAVQRKYAKLLPQRKLPEKKAAPGEASKRS